MKNIIQILLTLFLATNSVYGHGDLDVRISKVTNEIATAPDSTYLYFKRAKLYYQHEEYTLSIKDLDEAKEKGFKDILCELYYAKSYQQLGEYSHSIKYAENILVIKPQYVNALMIKAQSLSALKEFKKSAQTYEVFLNYVTQPLPENYIDASIAWENTNSKNGNSKSINILKTGLKELGEVYSLQLRLKEIYLTQGLYAQAIEIQNKLIKSANRKEHAYFKLFEIYKQKEDYENAKIYLQLAQSSIKILPNSKRNTSAIIDLQNQIKMHLTHLKDN